MSTPQTIEVEQERDWWKSYYYDTGCRYFDSCLNCPLPECLYEMSDKQRWEFIKERRRKEIEHG